MAMVMPPLFTADKCSAGAKIKAEGRRITFNPVDGCALCTPPVAGSVRVLCLTVMRDGDYSSQLGLAPPSADLEKGLHQQEGVCLWSGNVYVNGQRQRVGVDAGPEPILVWRSEPPAGAAATAAGTLIIYADEEERCRLPVPSGSVHFACSGDINGKADFEIDVERTEAAQREAEKGQQAFAEWLEKEAEEKAQAAASGGGGGCCLIS